MACIGVDSMISEVLDVSIPGYTIRRILDVTGQ